MVERFHPTLKTALRARENPSWAKSLSLVLLCIQSAFKEDLRASLDEMLCGTEIHLPGKFLDDTNSQLHSSDFVQDLRQNMRQLKLTPTGSATTKAAFIPQELPSKFSYATIQFKNHSTKHTRGYITSSNVTRSLASFWSQET